MIVCVQVTPCMRLTFSCTNCLTTSDSEEIGGLADAMNHMAAQLDSRIRTIVRERNEREAVLSSMSEAVVALDNQERIISINETARDRRPSDGSRGLPGRRSYCYCHAQSP